MSRMWVVVMLVLSQAGLAAEVGQSPGVERFLKMYESADRQEWQKPSAVMRLLSLSPGDKVADLGTGTGFFLPRLAIAVGDTGRVYAVDINQELLDFINTRSDTNRENITTILAEPDDPKLPEDELDLVLIVNTWHHLKKRVKYLKHVAAGLNRWGRVVVIDFHDGDLPVGPPPGEKLSRATVINEFEKAGWTFGGESVALQYQYYLIFEPPAGQ